jgi:hypothetical protein
MRVIDDIIAMLNTVAQGRTCADAVMGGVDTDAVFTDKVLRLASGWNGDEEWLALALKSAADLR